MNIILTAVIFEDASVYWAQGLEYDVAVQGSTLTEVKVRFLTVVASHISDNSLYKFQMAPFKMFQLSVDGQQCGPMLPIPYVNRNIIPTPYVQFIAVLNPEHDA